MKTSQAIYLKLAFKLVGAAILRSISSLSVRFRYFSSETTL